MFLLFIILAVIVLTGIVVAICVSRNNSDDDN